MKNEFDIPLFVDLDGTYTKTDLLFESFIKALKANPLIVFKVLFWLLKGKGYLKSELAARTEIDVTSLPLNLGFLSQLEKQKIQGRRLYLATASNEKFAKAICENTNLFEGFICSSPRINLKGKEKLKKIKDISNEFAYAGNDGVDFEIFKYATESILVSPTSSARRLQKKYPVDLIFDDNKLSVISIFKQLRIHQWLKNFLLFVPLFVSGAFVEITNFLVIAAAFVAFGMLASSTYILNDLLDLESDRSHPKKKWRPLASGDIQIPLALMIGLSLFVTSLFLSSFIGIEFVTVILSYLAITLFYSFKIKQYIGMDTVVLAILYTVRIIAGAAAIDVVVSFWLLAFSIFIFLSLALIKRCSELKLMERSGRKRASGRDYTTEDYDILKGFGASSALLSVLMFCFYINNNALNNQYQQPDILWSIVPALCYWLMRMWIKTHRGEMHDDPIVFSIRDKGSLITIGYCLTITVLAQIL